MAMTSQGKRQICARFDSEVVRVYQAYPPAIAERAIESQTFESPFKRDRMTWIKPSFTWMAYRSGWASKPSQEIILGIDILRSGFDWALSRATLSAFDPEFHASREVWVDCLSTSPVRVQWDPERTLDLQPMEARTIQIGLQGEAVDAYLDLWIAKIEDMTLFFRKLGLLVSKGDLDAANSLRPIETSYPLPPGVAWNLGCR